MPVTKKQEVDKKGPGKKKGEDDEDAYLDRIIKQTKEESKGVGMGFGWEGAESVLKMDRKFFNYKKELKQLFAKSA